MEKIEDAREIHEMKMKQLKFIRETERLKHEWDLERGRIKTAEIRKAMERKQNMQWLEKNGRN